MRFSRQEYWRGLPFPSPVDHILSDFSTMTRLSWVAPWAWLSFIELDKAVVLAWLDWLLFCEYGFSVSALWCSLATPTVFLLLRWEIFNQFLLPFWCPHLAVLYIHLYAPSSTSVALSGAVSLGLWPWPHSSLNAYVSLCHYFNLWWSFLRTKAQTNTNTNTHPHV